MSVLDGPGEGSWSVFAQKVVEERDALQAEVDRLKAALCKAEELIKVWRESRESLDVPREL